MPHSEAHPEDWPEIPAVHEKFDVHLYQPPAVEGDERVVKAWSCCYPSQHSVDGRRCNFLTNIREQPDGTLLGRLETIRYGGGDEGPLVCKAHAGKPYPEGFNALRAVQTWTPEQLAEFEAEHAVVESGNSNHLPMQTSKEYVPEPGMLLLLVLGILGLAVAGWRRTTR